MDASLALARLDSATAEFMARSDFEGAENLLFEALSSDPAEAVHLQLGRLYLRWSKLTSAVNHLHQAVEAAGAEGPLLSEILRELDRARAQRADQQP